WSVAAAGPPALKAICAWEGAADFYRDVAHHGGILCTFAANWYDMQVKTVQHGVGTRGARSRITGALVCGEDELDEERLVENRVDFGPTIRAHPLDDDYHRGRSPDWSRVRVPLLTAANWGGQGLHPRGNFEAYTRAASREKFLEVHGIEHWTEFYTAYGVALQKRFFACYLKGDDAAWDDQPPVQLQVRHLDRFVQRAEHEWPLARTRWTRAYLDLAGRTLDDAPSEVATSLAFDALGEGVTFVGAPLAYETELTGPLAATLYLSSSTSDADLFVILRAFAPGGEEVVFQGAIDPHTPLAQGWLRASHRALDPALSRPERPYHTHVAPQPLVPGEIVEVQVELWPTSIVLPAGYRLALTVRGKDYEYPGPSGGRLSNFKNELRGCGPFLHDDPLDRPPAVFGGTTILHADAVHAPFVLMPVIPEGR
ncbi:MAG: CocE/NonD family hydrolase, partial [Vulcanimicrobiaceae bacterium]